MKIFNKDLKNFGVKKNKHWNFYTCTLGCLFIIVTFALGVIL